MGWVNSDELLFSLFYASVVLLFDILVFTYVSPPGPSGQL